MIFVFTSCENEQNRVRDREISSVKDTINNESDLSEESFIKDKENESEVKPESSPLTIRDISSVELVKELKIGWNLGNTLDATGGGALLNTEMSWGNPATKEEMIITVKEAGFNVIRIPVSWGNHLGPEPEYTIHTVWLDRVNEVVDYAIDNELYVILNMHHEEWHFPSYDNLEKAEFILTKVWTQIAERFKDYDEHLIFEGMNEPRMKDTPQEWNGGNAEARDVINQLNLSFVETIRNSEGNNPYRHLMIPTYAASSDPKIWKDFVVPNDDKVIVSIHAYTPYHFALNKSGTTEWNTENANDTRDIDNLMRNLYDSFVIKGQPVILGEFGAMDKDNLEARVSWSEYYIQKATEKGIPCIWWDNGAFVGSGELFGLLDRRKLEWQHPEIVEALMKGLE
ncbi:MAG: glycoside hydrolase family 5 protein [Anaerolineaceae bacterium]|nr:MAG: glycoside hydrolase family 5 protein [Anaerolineaceae bacterium]